MSIGKRLKQVRSVMGLSQKDFAALLCVNQQTLSKYENEQLYVSDPVKVILLKNGVNINWLLSGDGEMFSSTIPLIASVKQETECLPNVLFCPILAEIAAGPPVEVQEVEPIDHISLDSTLLPYNSSVYCFRVNGHSMEPLIQHNDIVVITSVYDSFSIDHTIMAFRDPDGITLKQIIIDNSSKVTLLLPINHEYKPLVYNEESDLTIIGKLILSIRKY